MENKSEAKKFTVLGENNIHFGIKVELTRAPWPFFDVSGCDIYLDDFCTISSGVYIHTHTHQFHRKNWRELPKLRHSDPTIIGAYSFLGVNVQIMPSCKKIGEHSVIGAGSIVTKNVPDYEIWAGNPAIKVGTVNRNIFAEVDGMG